MGSPADLTLGTSQAPSTNATTNTATTTTTVLSKSSPSSFVGDRLQRMRKLEEYLQSLEDERRKIEAFKRELPLCMQLLDESKLCPTTPPKTGSAHMRRRARRSAHMGFWFLQQLRAPRSS
jgi:hypothetical protein